MSCSHEAHFHRAHSEPVDVLYGHFAPVRGAGGICMSAASLPCYENGGSALGDVKQPQSAQQPGKFLSVERTRTVRLCWPTAQKLTEVWGAHWFSAEKTASD